MPEEEDQSVISHQENWPIWALTIIVGILTLFFIYLVYGSKYGGALFILPYLLSKNNIKSSCQFPCVESERFKKMAET